MPPNMEINRNYRAGCDMEYGTENGIKYIFQCEDSMEGIFTGIYDAWASGVGHGNVELRTQQPENLEFFCEYISVIPDSEKAEKVRRSVLRKLGMGVYSDITICVYGAFADKANAIYHTLVDCLSPRGSLYGRKMPSGFHPGGTSSNYLENLCNPYVKRVSEMKKNIWTEQHRMFQFVRFRELKNGILFAKINPWHNVLPLIADHFSNRFPVERWMIYDEGRQYALAHEPGKGCLFMEQIRISEEYLDGYADVDGDYEELWWNFCQSIAIKPRTNRKLQQQFVPLKFRKNMVEFSPGQ